MSTPTEDIVASTGQPPASDLDRAAVVAIEEASAQPPANGAPALELIAKHDAFINQVYDFAIAEIDQTIDRLRALRSKIDQERVLTSERGRHFISMVEGSLSAVQGAHSFIASLESTVGGSNDRP